MQRSYFIPMFFLLLFSCQDSQGSNDQTNFNLDHETHNTFITNMVNNLAIEKSKDFQSKAESFATDAKQLCNLDPNTTEWQNHYNQLQTKLKDLALAWQAIEMLQFGPLFDNTYALKQAIYPWPHVSYCAVDNQVVTLADSDQYKLTTNNNAKGLSALTYLFFDHDLQPDCSSDVEKTTTWSKKQDTEKKLDRCQYAQLVADDIAKQSRTLNEAWLKYMTNNSSINLQNISDAFFYLDTEIKDKKLGLPSGLSQRCRTGSCPEMVEFPHAKISMDALSANLETASAMYTGDFSGSNGTGIKQLIPDPVLAQDLEDKIKSAHDNVTAAKNTGTLHQLAAQIDITECKLSSSQNRKVEICALYYDLKSVTDVLKNEFLRILNLKTPPRASGDND